MPSGKPIHMELQKTEAEFLGKTRKVSTLKKNIRVLSLTSVVGGAYWGMIRATWQPFTLSLGVSMSLLGLFEGLGGRNGLITALVQPVSGRLSDKMGRKPFIVLGSILTLTTLAFYTLACYTRDWRFLVPATISLGLTALSHPASSALTAESVEVRERGMAYSVTMFSFILPGVLTSAFGGWVADLFGYEILFLISIVLEGLSLSMLAFLLKETLNQRNEEKDMGRVSLKAILVPPSELRGFYVSMAADAFSWGLGAAILFGLLSKTYNFSNLQLGILSSLTFLMWTAFQLPIGKLIEKYGCKRFLILSEMIGIAMMIGWLTFTSFEVFALAALLYGLVASTWVPASQTLLSNSVEKEERAEAIGRLFAFRGIIGFPAPYVGGLLYEAMGFKAPILAGAIGVIVTLILIALFVREPE
ncbi:MAG: MFS transporter [Candidatus Bathyarchaeota archaeon]|nr:MFS transporter [Candidatus Bathyarchaeota archaeon]